MVIRPSIVLPSGSSQHCLHVESTIFKLRLQKQRNYSTLGGKLTLYYKKVLLILGCALGIIYESRKQLIKLCPMLQICIQHESLILTCEHCKEPGDRIQLKGTKKKQQRSVMHKSRFYMSNNVINMNKQHGPFYNSHYNTSAIVQFIRGNLYL